MKIFLFIFLLPLFAQALELGRTYQAEGHLVRAKMIDYLVIIDEKSESEINLKLPKKMWADGQLKNYEGSHIRFEFNLSKACYLFCVPEEFKILSKLSPFERPEIFARPGQR